MPSPVDAPPAGFRGVFRSDASARAVYSEAAGIARVLPAAVAVPAVAEDVVTLVRWAAAERIALVPRGSGSSMAGGAVGPGVIVDLGGLAHAGEVNVERRRLACGPGVRRDAVEDAARGCGLTFPVDPSSGSFCTVGGMAATNAAGARTLRHGSMRAWVSALDCVFADGSRAVLRRGAPAPDVPPVRRFLEIADDLVAAERQRPSVHPVRKESSGYALADYARSGDLVDLLVGSEGTLALFVSLELRLMPAPWATAGLLVACPTLDAAVAAAASARLAGAATCELLDRTFLEIAREGGHPLPISGATEAVLLVSVEDGTTEAAGDRVHDLEHACRAAGASAVLTALDEPSQRTLQALRHAASPSLSRVDPALRSMQFIEDGCVPPPHLSDYVRGVRAALARQNMRGVIFGHAGDAHVHVNPLVDVRLRDWRARVDALLDDVTALVASLGGTLSGEHGDGRLRAPLLARVWSDESLRRFSAVKNAFDPDGILNPGVKLAPIARGVQGPIKYDPTLPAHPPDAAFVLREVERERAYASARLEMLAAARSALDARP